MGCKVYNISLSIVPGHDDDKNKNANQSQVGIVMCLLITIENRSATGGPILGPIWDLEVGGVAEDGLDASESAQDLRTEIRTGHVKVYLSQTYQQSLAVASIFSGVKQV